jgi:membrane protein DedA with SNARE-associated domain
MTPEHLRELLTQYGYPLLLLVSTIEGTGMPGPIELFFVAAGVLIGRGEMSLTMVWLVVTLGNVLGNAIGYGVGRMGGRPLLDRAMRMLHIPPRAMQRVEEWFGRYGLFAQAISRWIGVTRTPAILGAGVVRAPLLPYLLGSLIGDGIWALFWSLLGMGIGKGVESLINHGAGLITLAVVVVAAAALVWWWLLRRSRSQG